MPRYVLLRHECSADYRDGPHWDLMLERRGVEAEHRLATWSLLALPGTWAEQLGLPEAADHAAVHVTELPDHRARYLGYEGMLSGNRGEVRQLASGMIEWVEASEDRVALRLLSGPLAGSLVLSRIAGTAWSLEA